MTLPHWPAPYQPSVTRRSAPNVLYVVWDDAGIATWNAFGGMIETPSLKWLAGRGLRYSQWHTPALSSPTHSCLMTGRGAVGVARVGRSIRGWREQSVIIPPDTGTLAEILRRRGYRTYCVGKWHLGPGQARTMTNTRRNWPLGRGFDRYYGFLGSQTSPCYPDLVYDNQHVDPPYPPEDGYHLNGDLADMAMEFIRDGTQTAPGRPWLCYLSFGASSVPHVAPREWTDSYRGRFDLGYDRYREIVLGNMKRLGVVPEETSLSPADGHPARGALADGHVTRPWRSLSEEQRQLSDRLAESSAGLCSYTDSQVGRLLSYLKESGQLDDTIVVVCSANTMGSPGGGPGVPPAEADLMAGVAGRDQGSAGWAWAFRTPYNMPRQYSLGGSAASPLIISWPREMEDVAGGVRDQYHHAVDIVPTILDCAAIDPPQLIRGYPQEPVHGVSMRYTFTAPGAPSARRTQLYETPVARAIYHDGWKAVARRRAITDDGNCAAGRWELYDVAADRTEIRDVAARYPEKVAELASLWGPAAGRDASQPHGEPGRPPRMAAARRRPALRAGGSRVAG